MKKAFSGLVKTLIGSALYYSESLFLYQKIFKNPYPIVIYYHRVHREDNPFNAVKSLSIPIDHFEKQIRYLKNNRNIVPLSEIIDYHTKRAQLPSNSIAITFDDGFRDNYTLAYPILKKYKIPATIFLTTDFIGTNRLPWWDIIPYILKKLSLKQAKRAISQNDAIPISIQESTIAYKRGNVNLDTVINSFKRLGETQRRRVIEHLKNTIDKDFFSDIPRQFLSWEEIGKMYEDGITFGSHSRTHCIFSQIDLDQAKEEIKESKKEIEDNLEQPIHFFSYPDGVFNKETKGLVKEAGYSAAFQTFRNAKRSSYDLFSLPRQMVKESHSTGIGGKFSESLFICEILGAMDVLLLRKSRRHNPYERVSE